MTKSLLQQMKCDSYENTPYVHEDCGGILLRNKRSGEWMCSECGKKVAAPVPTEKGQ